MRFLVSLIVFAVVFSFSKAQNYVSPLNIPIVLSANFGELRNNHFHSGLDYKTQQTINKPVFSIEDGFVSRISISPSGYGLALYIKHPTGHTSVYAHLSGFSKTIEEYVVQKQYEKESYTLNLFLKSDELPIKKGELIALSGNTGSSGGPHLHFEIRDTKTEEPLDVLEFLGSEIKDTQKPEIRGIAVYPQSNRGVVNGKIGPSYFSINTTKSGILTQLPTIETWGVIGFGVKGYDRMNGTNNVYGVKNVRLFVDNVMVFNSSIHRFSFEKSRMINSYIDFQAWRNLKEFYMKSFVEPGNLLPFYNHIQQGFVVVSVEKEYKVRYELEDFYGNTTVYPFSIFGKKQQIPISQNKGQKMTWNMSNWYFSANCNLQIPLGNLYDDFYFNHSFSKSGNYLSDIHAVNLKSIPLHKNGLLWIRLGTVNGIDTTKVGVVKIDRNGKSNWLGGTYKNGGVEVSINELGDKYAIDIDTVPPIIQPHNEKLWTQRKQIIIRLSDDKSGVSHFRGEINGKFALFRHDVKSNLYTYYFDDKSQLKRGRNQLQFEATDFVGNKRVYKVEFNN